MLKNFSQAFVRNPTIVFLLVEDERTGKFLLLQPLNNEDDYYNDGIYRPLHLEIDERTDIALHLAEYLYSFELLITSFRELNRRTSVTFSFKDDTPGSLMDTICLHATVDVPRDTRLDDYNMVLFPLKDLSEMYARGEHKTLQAGLARLLLEQAGQEA